MIIGLTGHAGSGKDTIARILVQQHGFVRYALADPLRRLTEIIFRLQIDAPYQSDAWVDEWDRLKRGSGQWRKTLQDIGVGCRDLLGEDVWLRAAEAALALPDTFRTLESCGLGCRDLRGEDLWLRAAEAILSLQDRSYRVVIPDIRFANEAAWLSDFGGHLWTVMRPGVYAVNDHRSEQEIDSLEFAHTLRNAGNLKDLEDSVGLLMDCL
jgi:hypothetical protein